MVAIGLGYFRSPKLPRDVVKFGAALYSFICIKNPHKKNWKQPILDCCNAKRDFKTKEQITNLVLKHYSSLNLIFKRSNVLV